MPALDLTHPRDSSGPGVRPLIGGAAMGVTLGVFVSLGANGCRGTEPDYTFDCSYQEEQFHIVAEKEGILLDPTPRGEPYPVAIKFTEQGVNDLLEGVVGEDVPFTGELPFVWYTGPSTLKFTATTEPIIELESLEGCPTCVQYSFDFSTIMYGPGYPEVMEAQGSGVGSVKFRIPMELEPNGEDSTTLVADYSRLRVQELWLNAFGLETEEHEALVGALGIFMEKKIQENYGPTDLLTLDSWEIGNNDVKLLARKLIVYPETDTLVLAMQSNLPLPVGGGLDMSGDIPIPGVPMVVDFDIALFESMIEHLLQTDVIPRIYDDEGMPDEDGNYGVTLDFIKGAPQGQEFMTTQFKVWRFADGYCGYVTATMDLDVDLVEGQGIVLNAGEVAVIGGEGAGSAATQEVDLVKDNQDVVENFRSGVADNLGTTINYDALAIEGSNIVFETLAKDVFPTYLETYIDFSVYEAPDP